MSTQFERDEAFLESIGWTVEYESPFEIRHTDGSFATGQAASITLHALKADTAAESAALSPDPLKELFTLIDQVEALQTAAAQQPDTAFDRWKICYGFVFSDTCSRRIRALLDQVGMDFSYYDPDMGYEDDVRAYNDALKQLKKDIGPFVAALTTS